MEDYVIGAIVGGIPLAMLLSISLFYSANQRLPHWLGNLCALPPTFSFKPKDATTQEYHDQVTVSIALLSGTPLLLCFVLYVFLISEIDVWSVSEWDTPLDVTTCAAAVLEEQNLHALLLSGIASTTNLTSYDVSKMHSAEVCADVPLGNLLSARGATDFRGAISSYELFYSDLMDTMLQKLNTILSSDERATVVNNVALLAVDSAVLDCEAVSDAASDNPFNATLNLKSIHFNTAAKALLNTVLLHLSDPSETYFHGLSSFYPLPDHTTIRTDRATHPSTASTPTNNIVQQTTHYADVLLQLSLHFDNRLRQVSEVGYENQSNIEHYVIAAFGVGLLLLAMACIIVVMVAHTIKLSWEVRLRKDFEGSNDNKDLYQGHIQNAGKLIVDGELEAGSEVELCFVNIIKSFREVKPFASHSLFEGELTDTEELFCEHPEVHTHRYALREEIGLRFKHAACMSVSTRLLNEFSVDEAEECADDITQDYSLLVAIIYKAASQYGGVVHNVTSGVITCTWNVSLMCTHVCSLFGDFSSPNRADAKYSAESFPQEDLACSSQFVLILLMSTLFTQTISPHDSQPNVPWSAPLRWKTCLTKPPPKTNSALSLKNFQYVVHPIVITKKLNTENRSMQRACHGGAD